MEPQLSKKEFSELKSLFSDYRTYNRGLARLFRIGLYAALFGTGFLWIIGTVVAEEFRLDFLLLLAILVFVLYLLFTPLIWAVVKMNARKFMKKINELQVTEEEVERMIKADLTKALFGDTSIDLHNYELGKVEKEKPNINEKLWKILQISSIVIAIGGGLITFLILPKERLPDGGWQTTFPSTTFQIIMLMIYFPLVFLFFFATMVRRTGSVSFKTLGKTLLFMATIGVIYYFFNYIID